jgi:hypothetical protein
VEHKERGTTKLERETGGDGEVKTCARRRKQRGEREKRKQVGKIKRENPETYQTKTKL